MPEEQQLQLREAMYALPRSAVEFPDDLVETRVQRLVDRGLSLEEATASEEAERSKLLPLHILRPCLGKGRGRHVYEATMLQENAEKFSGWRQYIDHLSPEAKRAARGLPRSIRDLGGRIVESYWDPNVPADTSRGFGQGAVVGWSLPTPFIRDLAENDPELVEASISASATGVQPVTRDGQRAWLVEGIEDNGSVDWVTEAGAGGRIVELMEAAYQQGEGLLEAMSDEEFITYVEELRPHLLTEVEVEVEEQDAEPDTDTGSSEELEAAIQKLMKRNPRLTRAQAEAMAKRSLSLSEATEGEDTMGITPESLQEALRSDDFREVLDEIVEQRARSLVEAAVADERDLIRAEVRADADRQLDLRDLRDAAHRQIDEAKLPDAFAERARARFDLGENGPTPELDIVDDVDDEGQVTKSARDKLQEAVSAAVTDQRELLASVRPTRVVGQGPASPAKDGEDSESSHKGDGVLYASMLQEAGVDPATAWDD
jgi:hypothetical protein